MTTKLHPTPPSSNYYNPSNFINRLVLASGVGWGGVGWPA